MCCLMTICKHYNGIHRISLLTIPTAILTIQNTHTFGIISSILKAHGVGVSGIESRQQSVWEGVEISCLQQAKQWHTAFYC